MDKTYSFLSILIVVADLPKYKKRHKHPRGQSTAPIYNHKQPMLG